MKCKLDLQRPEIWTRFDLFICLFLCLSVCLFDCLSASLSIYLSIYLSVCLSVYPSVYLSVCSPYHYILRASKLSSLSFCMISGENHRSISYVSWNSVRWRIPFLHRLPLNLSKSRILGSISPWTISGYMSQAMSPRFTSKYEIFLFLIDEKPFERTSDNGTSASLLLFQVLFFFSLFSWISFSVLFSPYRICSKLWRNWWQLVFYLPTKWNVSSTAVR